MSKKLVASRGMSSDLYLNKPVGGGPKKSGLAPSFLGGAGVSLVRGRSYMGGPRGVQANYRNHNVVFHYKSTIGGIGHNVGGRSLHRMMDGVQSVSMKDDRDSTLNSIIGGASPTPPSCPGSFPDNWRKGCAVTKDGGGIDKSSCDSIFVGFRARVLAIHVHGKIIYVYRNVPNA